MSSFSTFIMTAADDAVAVSATEDELPALPFPLHPAAGLPFGVDEPP